MMLLLAGISLIVIAAVFLLWLSGRMQGRAELRAGLHYADSSGFHTQRLDLEAALRDTRLRLEDAHRVVDLTRKQLAVERRRADGLSMRSSGDDWDEEMFDLSVPPDVFSIYSGDIPTPIPVVRCDEEPVLDTACFDPVRSVISYFSHRAFAQVGLGVLVADIEGKVVYINSEVQLMTGWTLEGALHRSVDEVLNTTEEHGLPDVRLPRLEQLGQEDVSASRRQLVLHHRAGNKLEIKRAAFAVRDRRGQRIGRVVLVRDKVEERLMNVKAAGQIQHDPVTGLFNRQSFSAHLSRALEQRSGSAHSKAFLFIDIDHFGVVNDTCGFEAGDALLQWVAAALRESVKEHDVVARLGCDEFGVLLSVATTSEAEKMARDIQTRLRAFSFAWAEKTIDVTMSMALLPLVEAFKELDSLLGVASQLCGIAKDNGGNQVQSYRTGDGEVARRRADMMQAALVKGNLREGKFHLWAQPIQPLSPTRPQGLRFEVLLRCLDGDDRFLSPVDVIRAAERHGGMVRLDRWVIKKTLETLAGSPALLEQMEMCSINLSGASLKSSALLEFVHEQFRAFAVPPSKICFELTETAAVENLGRALRVIDGLCALGCQFALDDFGSGLASYGYIKDLPVTHIKIDGGFVSDMAKNTLNRAIVESIHQIGHFLGIETTAEAVSSAEVLQELKIMGVDYAQGFFVARPAPLGDVLGVPVLGTDRPSAVPGPPIEENVDGDPASAPTLQLCPSVQFLGPLY